jgi:hypothetical protein
MSGQLPGGDVSRVEQDGNLGGQLFCVAGIDRYAIAIRIGQLKIVVTKNWSWAIASTDNPFSIRVVLYVIAHPAPAGGWTGSLAASTNWRAATTEAWLAFAVLTSERKAA